ncbi:MAG: diaminopimelate decarboxylase [Rhodospirillales bacterium]|nr:diaminopimelate decarboxylase [Rhodospirillales bacterium]MCB9995874.1 diaminopimelate decarboxylase [Rhodospirillales bacterium]
MIGFNYKDGVLYADNVALPALAEEYGTPLYVYSAGRLRENVDRLRSALQKALPADRQPLIAFACKANSNLAVLRLLGTMGLGSDIVSGGELDRVLTAGIPADKVVYSGVGKSDEELLAAINADILQINVESRAELERIAGLAEDCGKKTRIAFRMNPDVDAETHHKIATGRHDDKFGMTRAEIEELYVWAHEHDFLEPYGLQMHIGSQLTNMKPFREAYEKLAAFATKIKDQGLPLRNLDLGGGLGIIYKDETPPDLDAYAEIIRDIILPLGTDITLEPGRFIAGDAGLLLCRVSYIKQSEQVRHLILDAGMNDLVRPAMYDAYHEVRPVVPRAGDMVRYDVVGPVCETGDTFIRDYDLPETRKRDYLALMCAGAYGFVMASNYNTRPLPAEVLVDGDKSAIIRHRQTVRDILDLDTIPGWLTT